MHHNILWKKPPDGVTKALKSTDIYANSVLFCYIITYFYAVSRIFTPYHF